MTTLTTFNRGDNSKNPNYRKGRGPSGAIDSLGQKPLPAIGSIGLLATSPFNQAPRVTKTLVVVTSSLGAVTTADGQLFHVALPCEHIAHQVGGQWGCRFRCDAWKAAA